jgi:hypothetical protein
MLPHPSEERNTLHGLPEGSKIEKKFLQAEQSG